MGSIYNITVNNNSSLKLRKKMFNYETFKENHLFLSVTTKLIDEGLVNANIAIECLKEEHPFEHLIKQIKKEVHNQ